MRDDGKHITCCVEVYRHGARAEDLHGFCSIRARWFFDGLWYCSNHDPLKPRCTNAIAHPITDERRRELAAIGVEVIGGGHVDPMAPVAAGKFPTINGPVRALCSACARPGSQAALPDFMPPVAVRPPCSLCGGTACLYDDAEKPFPCVCTPGGRCLANGVPDSVVRARIEERGQEDANDAGGRNARASAVGDEPRPRRRRNRRAEEDR